MEKRPAATRYRRIFESTAVSLWEEDFSAVKLVLDELRAGGGSDLRSHFDAHPELVDELIAKVRIIDVNPATLRLFGAGSKDELLSSLEKIFVPETRTVFIDELIAIANGEREFAGEALLRTLDGEQRYVLFSMAFQPDDPKLEHVLVTVTDVTARRQAEILHSQMEQRYRLAVRATDGVVWDWDVRTGSLLLSHGLIRFGYDAAEAGDDVDTAYPWWIERIHAEDRARVDQSLQSALQGSAETWTAEYRFRRADGSYAHIQDRAVIARNDQGLPVRIVGWMLDVSEHKRAEHALAAAQERFARFAQHLPAAAWIKDAQGRYVYANPVAQRIFRTALSELTGKTDDQVFPAATARSFRKNDQSAIETRRAIQVVETLQHEDGIHQSLVSKFPIFDETGVPTHVGGVALDMTDRIRAEEALKVSESRLRLAMNAAHLGAWEWDIQTGQISWSPTLEAIHGLAPGTFGGTFEAFQSDVLPEDRDRVLRTIATAVEQQNEYQIEYRIIRPDKQVRWLEARGQVLTDALGLPERMAGVCMDITERKQLEMAREHFAAIVASTDDAIISKDLNGIITSWNKAAERIFGYTAKEALGQPISILAPPGRSNEMAAILERIRRGERVDNYETVRKRKNGTLINISLTISPIRAPDGRVIGASKIARDITEQVQAREALRVANQTLQRMNEDLTQFSYAASHDLKEPLRQVALYAELLSNDYRGKLDDTAQLYLGFCLEGARRMLDLVRGLSAYVGIDKSDGQGGASADAGAVLEIVRRNLGEAIAESATTLTAGPLPRVAVREAHLIQLFQNVIDNAIKYRHPARTAVISVSADRSDGEWTFSVKDNGIGIDSRYYDQIFKVFKRLQRHTPGTGIGLAMCQRIVERYNGRIWVQSEPEAGSTFFFTLPAEN